MLFHVARLFAFFVVVTLLNLGCALDAAPPAAPLGVAGDADDIIVPNSLPPDALIPIATNPDALDPSTLPGNALTSDALDPGAAATLQDPGDAGTLSRMFVKYLVGCALDGTQSFAISWTDTTGVVHDETYPGDAGIATAWAEGPIDSALTPLVSACLAARTNYFGVVVWIDTRSALAPFQTTDDDPGLTTYPFVEGAFWGDVFSASPQVFACYDADNVLVAQAAQRVCAAGLAGGSGSPCSPLTVIGDCSQTCGALGSGQYYASCTDQSGVTTDAVITTALP
jgi:hypothetical protein